MSQDQSTGQVGANQSEGQTVIEWLYEGSAGGKGEGLVALAALTSGQSPSQLGAGSDTLARHTQSPGLPATIPRTGIVGTKAWDDFLAANGLADSGLPGGGLADSGLTGDGLVEGGLVGGGLPGDGLAETGLPSGEYSDLRVETEGYQLLRKAYLAAELPASLVAALKRFLPPRGRPLMVRSSSMLEDETDTPFAGIFESYALPNSHPDDDTRLSQLCDAVKLVYASLYSPGARAYRSAIAHDNQHEPVKDKLALASETGSEPLVPANSATCESMAVIIQELVGKKRGRWFYPLISGTAQSLNYYAISHAKPEDGLCTAALGLGTYVVEGGATQQFCPKWPGIQVVPPELAGSGSQTSFCALDAELDEPDLVQGSHATLGELSLVDAEGMGALDYVASTWDRDDLRLVPGASVQGPRIIDLGPILKYDALPLAPAISEALSAAEALTKGPVELEYALDEAPDGSGPTLYLLQLKRLRRLGSAITLDFDTASTTDCSSSDDSSTTNGASIIRSEQAMGDGIIQGLADLVWLDHDSFDRSRSIEAAEEVALLDRQLKAEGRPYILIGPGRWGSRDPWLGVPVDYSQITNARVIVETEMPGLSVDFSFGSHFLRNVTGLGIGYLAIPSGGNSTVNWDYIKSLPKITALRFATHSRSTRPLEVLIDGVGRRALVRGTVP